MRFALSAEQREFAASLHELLCAADTPAVARGYAAGDREPARALWKRLAEVGVAALAVPERFEGLDAHPVDLVVAFEEIGHHAVPGPLVESAATAVLLAGMADAPPQPYDQGGLAGATEQQGRLEAAELGRWLAGLASGELVASFVLPPHVPYALDADEAQLVVAVEEGTLTRMVATANPQTSVDPARRLFSVAAGEALAWGEAVRRAAVRAFELGALATAAQLIGAGRALLETTTDYANRRAQFGRPIGSFQAVKHRLADVYVALELARALLYGAAVAAAERPDTVARDISAAKVACAKAADRAARAALQVHGAVGYTRECDLVLWLTKVRALTFAWGDGRLHRARVRSALAAGESR
jgi:alkylation response protein AidB-like acyl-CoA dehydrogenase